jgi:alanine dehydrogenase
MESERLPTFCFHDLFRKPGCFFRNHTQAHFFSRNDLRQPPARRQTASHHVDGAIMSAAPAIISDGDVQRLLSVEDAVESLEAAFRHWDQPDTVNLPRQRANLAPGSFNVMAAAHGADGVFGLKAYFGIPNGSGYYVILFSRNEARMVAVLEANSLGRLRTGAASGLATKYLARADAQRLAVIGTGRQAAVQIAAIKAVRPLSQVTVFSRNPERRRDFARSIEKELSLPTDEADSLPLCVADADIVTTITNSAVPVLRAEWLKQGIHINAAGANSPNRREIDQDVVLAADRLVTDSIEQARQEAAEFRDLVDRGLMEWDRVDELGQVICGIKPGRTSQKQITLFKSLGIALEDIAVADLVYRRFLQERSAR